MYKIRGADGREYGPASVEEIRRWVAEGRANAHTLAQGPESTEWKPLGSFPEFAGAFPAPAAPPLPTAAPIGSAGAPPVPNYLVQAILVTLCCCLPFGIVAIIYSAQVNSKLGAGDLPGAMAVSQKARMWCWIAVAGGAIWVSGWLIVQGITGGLSRLLGDL